MAHTSPCTCAAARSTRSSTKQTIQYMLTLVEGSLTHIRERTRSYRPPVTHHHGEHDHAAYLERPFQEAFEALHALLHAYGIDH